MTPALKDLEPKAIWKHFDAIAQIPRASTKEAGIREYVLGQAKQFGLEGFADKVGNVIVRKPARPGRENAAPAMLQGHLDMVCEKDEATQHNFDTDPIRILRDGDWLTADGTTLGSDNGVGVATALAIMESTNIAHGPLEFVFTMDEETGMTGANAFEPGLLKAKYYLNLDGEEDGTLTIGCAGGLNTIAKRKIAWKTPAKKSAWRVKVAGLKGGHSGVDIHLGRANALRILGQTLQGVIEKIAIEVADIKGGSAHNAIPREAHAVILADSADEQQLKSVIAAKEAEQKADFGTFDPGLKITVESAPSPSRVFDDATAKAAVDLLAAIHHGVLAMSPDVPGLVQNSTNLATASVKGDYIEIATSQRSAVESSKLAAAQLVSTVCRLAGFEVTRGGSYPGWKPEPNSDIARILQGVHTKVFGKPANLAAMHAGLECGIIGVKYPGMQMISFGPQIEHPHSPSERVQISSVQSFWKYLRAVLEAL